MSWSQNENQQRTDRGKRIQYISHGCLCGEHSYSRILSRALYHNALSSAKQEFSLTIKGFAYERFAQPCRSSALQSPRSFGSYRPLTFGFFPSANFFAHFSIYLLPFFLLSPLFFLSFSLVSNLPDSFLLTINTALPTGNEFLTLIVRLDSHTRTSFTPWFAEIQKRFSATLTFVCTKTTGCYCWFYSVSDVQSQNKTYSEYVLTLGRLCRRDFCIWPNH